jgi:hypothetical protein
MRVTWIKNSGEGTRRDQGWNEKGSPFSGEPPFVAWEFYLRRASISHLPLRERRVEVPKRVKKVSKTIDSVARGRASSLATFSICVRKIRVIRCYKFSGL